MIDQQKINTEFTISSEKFKSGIYFYTIKNMDETLVTGKIAISKME
jgi:hypothetical protein